MSDPMRGLRQVIRDFVVPDLKSHSATLDAFQTKSDRLQKQTELQHNAMMNTLDAFRAEMRSEFASLRANNQVEVFRQVTPISERVAVVEARVRQG